MIKINDDLSLSEELDYDFELLVDMYYHETYIDKVEAIIIIDHLRKVFGISDTSTGGDT